MSQYNDDGFKTFSAGGAIAQHLRVYLSGGSLAAAGATQRALGTLRDAAFADGDARTVLLRTKPGTRKMVASEAITAGNRVYAAASGKVGASGSIDEGMALESATDDGDVIEVLTDDRPEASVVAVAAAGSAQGDAAALTAHAVNSVSAADGTKGVVLPAAAAGLRVEVYNSVATNGLKIYPATADTINGGSANAAVTIEGKTHATFVATDSTNWAALFTANT